VERERRTDHDSVDQKERGVAREELDDVKVSSAQRKAETLRLKKQGRGNGNEDRPFRVRMTTSEGADRRGGRGEGERD
jgi:hypothetical protein